VFARSRKRRGKEVTGISAGQVHKKIIFSSNFAEKHQLPRRERQGTS
jgi:hypothetical protein